MMNRREFENYFVSLYKPLGMYALRMLGDVDAAEDVVQEAFAAAWTKIGEGVEIEAFKPYMYRAVRNGVLMRERGKHESLSLDSPDAMSLADDDGAVSDAAVELSERDARLWSAVDALPERCRQVLLACKRDGLSYAETASELGISVKTVENQMTKALRILRESLGPERGTDRMILLFF